MSDSSASPDWTDHDVSDPGITLLEALVYGLGALTVLTGAAMVRHRWRARSCVAGARCAAAAVGEETTGDNEGL